MENYQSQLLRTFETFHQDYKSLQLTFRFDLQLLKDRLKQKEVAVVTCDSPKLFRCLKKDISNLQLEIKAMEREHKFKIRSLSDDTVAKAITLYDSTRSPELSKLHNKLDKIDLSIEVSNAKDLSPSAECYITLINFLEK